MYSNWSKYIYNMGTDMLVNMPSRQYLVFYFPLISVLSMLIIFFQISEILVWFAVYMVCVQDHRFLQLDVNIGAMMCEITKPLFMFT